jgi:hypothetical protein
MDEHSKMVSKLFLHTDDLRVAAAQNGMMISTIKEKLDNGITEHLEKKIDSMCKMIRDQQEKSESEDQKFADRLKKLEGISWIPMLIDKGSKKVVATIIAIVIGVSAMAHTALWAIFKSTYFGEKPLMMKSIASETSRHHVHELEGGGYVVHPPHLDGVEPPLAPVIPTERK